jgi:hypothetical protein
MYVTPQELLMTPLGLGLANHISALPVGSVEQTLARASQQCDSYCERRLQAPGSSTLSVSANAGDTSISVVSTNTLDELAELAVMINPGAANQELITIDSGGVTVTNWSSPYPGTIKLQNALQYNHAQNEVVQYYLREVSETGSSSSSDPYTEAIQTQAMQIALAHMPTTRIALTRIFFTKTYPIIKLVQVEHAFSFDNVYNNINMGVELIEPTLGYVKVNVGTVLLKEGYMRVTYSGGYENVPQDVKEATMLFFAESVRAMVNPFGATSMTLGKRSQSWGWSKDGDTPLVAQAKQKLKRYKRLV